MKAMILAAGRGSRLAPLTDNCPKPLISLQGKPLIVYHLEKIASMGIKEVVINVCYLAEMIQQTLGNGSQYGVSITYSVESTPLEAAGGIMNALPLLGKAPFLVVSADIWTLFPYTQLTLPPNALAQLMVIPRPPWHTGDFDYHPLHAQLERETTQRHYTYGGVGLFTPAFFLPRVVGKVQLEPYLSAAAHSKRLYGCLYQGEWEDLGTPARLKALDSRLNAKNT